MKDIFVDIALSQLTGDLARIATEVAVLKGQLIQLRSEGIRHPVDSAELVAAITSKLAELTGTFRDLVRHLAA